MGGRGGWGFWVRVGWQGAGGRSELRGESGEIGGWEGLARVGSEGCGSTGSAGTPGAGWWLVAAGSRPWTAG